MKNQNDLIVRIVAIVLGLIGVGVIYFNKPQPVAPPDPERVPVVRMELPGDGIVRTNGLPNAGENQLAGQAPGAGPGAGGGAPLGPVTVDAGTR